MFREKKVFLCFLIIAFIFILPLCFKFTGKIIWPDSPIIPTLPEQETPTCTSNDWSSSLSPTICPSTQNQTKTWIKIGQCELGVTHPASEIVSCSYTAPTCTSFTYSSWSACSTSGTQTRNVLTSSPTSCVGGNPLITSNCEYTGCASGQIQTCDGVENAVVTGYKLKCGSNGVWSTDSNCSINCNVGYIKVFDSCILNSTILTYKSELSNVDFKIDNSTNYVKLKENENNNTLLQINNSLKKIINYNNLKLIRSNLNESREFLIVNNLTLNEGLTKSIYLEKKNSSSNGLCFSDRDNLKNISDILASCIKIKCPSFSGGYSCEISNSTFIISGLVHSGVVEDYLYCGDSECTGEESCSSCPSDCRVCPIIQTSSGSTGGVVPTSTGADLNVSLSEESEEITNGDLDSTPISGVIPGDSVGEKSFIGKYWWIFLVLILLIIMIVIIIAIMVKKRRDQQNIFNNLNRNYDIPNNDQKSVYPVNPGISAWH